MISFVSDSELCFQPRQDIEEPKAAAITIHGDSLRCVPRVRSILFSNSLLGHEAIHVADELESAMAVLVYVLFRVS